MIPYFKERAGRPNSKVLSPKRYMDMDISAFSNNGDCGGLKGGYKR